MTAAAPRTPGSHRRYVAAILGLGIPLNGGLVGALALAIAAPWDPRVWARTPLDLPVAAWLAWSVMSAALSEFRQQALLAVLGGALAIYLAYQIPYRWFRSQPDLMDVMYRWSAAALPVAAAIGLASYLLKGGIRLAQPTTIYWGYARSG